ncbi:MAG: 3-hydroxyacyl-CoA dehydrogenase NAD-binding domain-containing protein [Candidatus Coatesbacteria bacterium]
MTRTRIELNGRVAHLILDDPGAKVNTLGAELLAELAGVLGALATDPAVGAVVIRSGKSTGFIAGADLNELGAIAVAPDARERGLAAARLGQALMNTIEDFPKPVVAAVNGACLGGGLELALACHGRAVSSDPSTKLGLPELRFGIVPGFGGTRRLPQLIGLMRGLEGILSSRSWSGRQALKLGLADDYCFPEQLPEVAEALAAKLGDAALHREVLAARRKTLPAWMRLLHLPGLRHLLAMRVRAEVMKKTHGRYPAPLRVIRLVIGHWGGSRDRWLAAEAGALGDTVSTRVAQNLIRLFFLGKDAAKQAGTIPGAAVETVGLVGTGLMGSGIAVALADHAGVRVPLKGTSAKKLGPVLRKVWDYEAKRIKRRQIERVSGLKRFQLLSPGTDYGGFRNAGVVIEAVQESLELKRRIYVELEAILPAAAVIATNTSSLSIDDLATGMAHPERLVGMHFFMPAEVMPLVEVIPGSRSSPEAVAAVVRLALAMDKTPVVVKDTPGFLVNRVLVAYALEAARMVGEGVPASRVDGAATAFGFPMGPVRLVAEVGVDVMREVVRHLQAAYGDRLPAPAWIGREDLARAFTKGRDGKWAVNGDVIAGWTGKPDPGTTSAEIEQRLFAALLDESRRCLLEGVVASAGLLDLAMVYGTGFPPDRGGPIREGESRAPGVGGPAPDSGTS